MVQDPRSNDPDRYDVRLALDGDAEAFARIVVRNEARLRRMLRGLLRDGHLVDDALQEVWVSAWRHLDVFAGRARLHRWLRTIAAREAWRLQRRRGPAAALDTTESGEPPCAAPGPEAAQDARDELVALMAQLPTRARAAVMLTAAGWSYAEVAAHLEAPLGSVGTWIHRARPVMDRARAASLA